MLCNVNTALSRGLQRRIKVAKLCRSTSTSTATRTNGPPYQILFCGSDTFAKTVVAALHRDKDVCSSLSVLTASDAPNQWSSRKRQAGSAPVKDWAASEGVAYDNVGRDGFAAVSLPPFMSSPNRLLMTASFGRLIPATFLDLFPPMQRLNLHPSLLPQLAGAAPIQWAIARQLSKTGVTLQTLGEKFDSGEVLAQVETPVASDATYTSLDRQLAEEASKLLLSSLRKLPSLYETALTRTTPLSNVKPSRAAKVKGEDSTIQWDQWSAEKIEARHRAFGYLHALRTKMRGTEAVLLYDVTVTPQDQLVGILPQPFLQSMKAGTACYSATTQSIFVRCCTEQPLLEIRQLQSSGKKVMQASQWIHGYQDRCDDNGLLHFV